jgi:hypothetical protein
VLPLPADVGEAIAGYLVKARPPSASRHVFTVVVAPFRGMGASTVTQLVQRACERAGVPSFGPHGMRHAAAGAGPGHIAKPGTLRAQLGRQVPVITGLEQQRQHRGIQRAVSHSVLVELAHRGQDVVDPARAPDPALPGAGPGDRGGLEHHHEHPQGGSPGKKIPPARLAPPQIARQIPGISAGGALGPVSPQAQVAEVGIGEGNRHRVIVDDGPVGQRAGQLDTQGLHQDPGNRCDAQLSMWRTIGRRSDRNTARRLRKRHPVTVSDPLKSGRARGR